MKNIEDEFLDKIIIPNFRNRVLTPYLEDWGDGKPGALYFSEKNCALVKLDTPWRKNASSSEYQTPLPCELELMDNEDFWVARGLPAFLISGADFAMESKNFEYRLFDQLFMHFRSFTLREYFETFNFLLSYDMADMKSNWDYTKSHLHSFSPCLVEGGNEEWAQNWMSLINHIQDIIDYHIWGVYDLSIKQLLEDALTYKIKFGINSYTFEKLSINGYNVKHYLNKALQTVIIKPAVDSAYQSYTLGGFPAFLFAYFINDIYNNNFYQRGITNTKIKGIHSFEIDDDSFLSSKSKLNQIELFESYTNFTLGNLKSILPNAQDIPYAYVKNNGERANIALMEYERYFLCLAKEILPHYLPKKIVDRIKMLTDNFLEFFIEKYYSEEARFLPSALTPAFRELFPMPAPMSKQMPMPTSMPQLNPMPMPTPQPAPESGLPPEGNYVAVATWLEKEKAEGRDYLKEAGYNRAKMCRNLSEIFKWEVDSNSLGKTLKRRN